MVLVARGNLVVIIGTKLGKWAGAGWNGAEWRRLTHVCAPLVRAPCPARTQTLLNNDRHADIPIHGISHSSFYSSIKEHTFLQSRLPSFQTIP